MFRHPTRYRQCVTVSLRRHPSPLCHLNRRPSPTPIIAVTHTQHASLWNFVSRLVGSAAPTKAKPRKRKSTVKEDKVVGTRTRSTKSKQAVVTEIPTTPKRKSTKVKDGASPSVPALGGPKKRSRSSKSLLVAPVAIPAPQGLAAGSAKRKSSTKTAKRSIATAVHCDLTSYEDHARVNNKPKGSSVYQGTRFEYLTAEALIPYHFALERCGGAYDNGIDLIGHWTGLPDAPAQLKCIIQCKKSKCTPAYVRELEGSYHTARAVFRGEAGIAILASPEKATKGVIDAMRQSRIPMAFVQVQEDLRVTQFHWNDAAAKAYLTGMTVNPHFKKSTDIKGVVGLHWMGKLWSILPSKLPPGHGKSLTSRVA